MDSSVSASNSDCLDDLPAKGGRLSRSIDVAAAIVILLLVLIEFACFYPVVGKVGFYLDDWSMLANLNFGPRDLIGLTLHCLQDPKVLIRPVEAPYFVGLFLAFGDKALGHHLVNGAFEVAAALFLYLWLVRLCGQRVVAFLASALFLLYPAHDSTHYWVTASSVSVSLALLCASWWFFVRALQDKSARSYWSAVALFALSVYNYESFMPLCAVHGACALALHRSLGWRRAILLSLRAFLPFATVVFSMWLYQRIALPHFHAGYTRPLVFSFWNVLTVIGEGINCTLSPHALAFFNGLAQQFLAQGWRPANVTSMAGALFAVFTGWAVLSRCQRQQGQAASIPILHLPALGLFIMVVSFSIFGVAADYHPTLSTSMNRINAGACLGVPLVLIPLLAFLAEGMTRGMPRRRWLVCSLMTLPLVAFCMLVNWGYAQHWTASWQVQKHVRALVRAQAANIKSGDSVILADCPRYAQWSPVFDGVWDFQAMLRLSLGNPAVNGGVVSERIHMLSDAIEDISHGFLCGRYPFGSMYLLLPAEGVLLPVRSPDEFIQMVSTRATTFAPAPETIPRWRQELIRDRSAPSGR